MGQWWVLGWRLFGFLGHGCLIHKAPMEAGRTGGGEAGSQFSSLSLSVSRYPFSIHSKFCAVCLCRCLCVQPLSPAHDYRYLCKLYLSLPTLLYTNSRDSVCMPCPSIYCTTYLPFLVYSYAQVLGQSIGGGTILTVCVCPHLGCCFVCAADCTHVPKYVYMCMRDK